MPVSVEIEPDGDVQKVLSQGIQEFNEGAIPGLEPVSYEQRFFVVARDATGIVTGGLRAACYWNTLHIELLWLSSDARGSGTGQAVLRAAEDFATKAGCEKALVETTSWQARPFYEKNGYTLLATLEGRPKGFASYYLAKDLKRLS